MAATAKGRASRRAAKAGGGAGEPSPTLAPWKDEDVKEKRVIAQLNTQVDQLLQVCGRIMIHAIESHSRLCQIYRTVCQSH